MKKTFTAIIIAAAIFLCGCNPQADGPATESKVLRLTQAIYMDVRTVITDPEVIPMFTPKEIERLVDLEKTYLEVADTLRRYPNDAEAIEKLSYISTEILEILHEVTYVAKVRPYVAAIRISVKILKNHL